jgi:[ribosomal protein S18]-alanine N-acetyltransferase
MDLDMALATDAERAWSARLMAGTEPWMTLRRSLAMCEALLAPAPDSELFIAHRAGGPTGFLFLRPRGLAGSPYIASIAVAQPFRDQGVGTVMLRFAERRYVPPARHIFLCVSHFNEAAVRLYQRVGYAQVGDIPDYLIPGQHELIMHKRLAP